MDVEFETSRTRVLAEELSQRLRPELKLEVVSGPGVGQTVCCEDPLVHIGSQSGNALTLPDDAVSRIHVELSGSDAGIRVRDLASTNGTWFGSHVRISEAVVPSGSIIRLGRSDVRLELLDRNVAEALSPAPAFGEMVGISASMRAVFALLERVAPTDETVLITGETGTGKEACARSIVARSLRADKPFVTIDCGALSPSLIESEFFGYTKGAFTDAVTDKQGAFQRANGGTLFLDEIGELPLEFQTRLLRVVENRTIRPVGGSVDVPLDIRILAATNRRLEEEVNRGTFRADLYYRLSVVQVRLPPLHERVDDLEPLADHLLHQLNVGDFELQDADREQLKRYRWPGNVRELRNYLRRLTLGDRVTSEFSSIAQDTGHASGGDANRPTVGIPPAGQPGVDDGSFDLSLSFKEAKDAAVARFEKRYLTELIKRADGNVSRAARMAQTDRTHLARLCAKHGIR